MTGAPPAAGIWPWAMWGLAAIFYSYGFFQRVAPSVMVAELMRDFSVGAAITGILSALYFYAYASLQVPVGVILDRWGARRLLTGAALLAALGSLFFSQAQDLMPAYLGRALIGIGASVTWVGALKVATVWFPPRRFALVTGLTMAAGMVGAVGGQAPLSAAVAAFGWRATLVGAGLAGLALALAIWLVVRDRPPGERDDKPASEEGRRLLSGLVVALKNPQTHFIGLYGGLLAAPMLAFAGLWGVPYLMLRHGIERPAAAAATSVFLVGWGVGSPLVGWLSDRIGLRRIPMMLCVGLALASTLVWLFWPGLPLAACYPFFFLTGMCAGGMVLCFASAREHNPAWTAGATLGLANMMVIGNGAIWQSLIGWFLDLGWDGTMANGVRVYSQAIWDRALLALPLCYLGAFLLLLGVRETHCKAQKS
ncbi:MAG: MFS transporter [Rhodospirillales bacterium]|nr:MFS transporter [Rhodospirillales bacterium]